MAGAPGRVVAIALLCWAVAACGNDPPNEAPSATVAVGRTSTTTTGTAPQGTTTTTTEPRPADPPATTAEEEVEAAYLRSWDIYTDAMLRLDPSRLDEVYSGPALETREQEVANLEKLGTPGRMRVEHDYEIVVLNADDAIVLESYLNHSVLLDGRTMQPIEPDPDKVVKREYVLRREPSGWRVSHINAGS